MSCLYQVNIYFYCLGGKICVQCLVYSPCCWLICLLVMANVHGGIITVTCISPLFSRFFFFFFFPQKFWNFYLFNQYLFHCFFFFFVSFLHISPLTTELIIPKGNKQEKKRDCLTVQCSLKKTSVALYLNSLLVPSELLMQQHWNYTRLSYSIIASSSCINTDSEKFYLQTSCYWLQQKDKSDNQ